MKDGTLRRAVKAVARWRYGIDLRAWRAVSRLRGADPYRLGGDCRRCAKCCEAPSIRVGWLRWYFPTLRRLFLWWQERINGFVLVGRDDRSRVFTFRCTHFDVATRSCDSYDSRPGMCRDYPRGLLHQVHPAFFPECGYRPVHRNAAQLIEAIDRRTGLTPEQKQQLKRDLFLV